MDISSIDFPNGRDVLDSIPGFSSGTKDSVPEDHKVVLSSKTGGHNGSTTTLATSLPAAVSKANSLTSFVSKKSAGEQVSFERIMRSTD